MGFLWLAVCAALFFSKYYPGHPPAGASEWHRRSEAAALGLLAAAAYRVTLSHVGVRRLGSRLITGRLAPLATLALLAAATLCYLIYEHQGSANSPLLKYTLAPLFLACSINHLAQAPAWFRHILSSPFVCWFGISSFSLYLWQQPFYYAHENFGLPLAPALLGALGCGVVSFYFWENPLREYLNAKWLAYRSVSSGVSDEVPSKAA